MTSIIIPALFLPLLGFISLIAFFRFFSRFWTGIIACSTVFISFLLFTLLTVNYVNGTTITELHHFFDWIPIKGIQAGFTLRVDALSLLMTLIVTGIGFLIHLFSIGYMEHDEDLIRYFAFLNFFIFAMLLLVLSENLLLLFVGWEGVGLASYLLIGFWYERPAAAQAATKAFVMNRIGDLGLLIGIILTLYLFGSSNISDIQSATQQGVQIGIPLLTILTLLYFMGATGKSAQIPLLTWLPDAMEGPTPVSALIHAATMVTAGVYLVVRMHFLFSLTPITLQIITLIGIATSLISALAALAQSDLKKVLAYSTISQLGLMFVACGAGAYYSSMFHLTTHAFVKALLFLSAANVIHMLHGIKDMSQMGGLADKFPKTHWLFLIGVLALSGIPPFAPFFSKDLILEHEFMVGFDTIFYIGMIISILTACYLTRAYCLTFAGKPRNEEVHSIACEVTTVMFVPLVLLAILSIIGGFLGFSFLHTPPLEEFLDDVTGVDPIEEKLTTHFHVSMELLLTIISSFLAVIATALLYTRYPSKLKKPLPILRKAFYIDEIYSTLIVQPLEFLSTLIGTVVESKIFNGSINRVTNFTWDLSGRVQVLQSGLLRSYIAWTVVGMVFLLIYLVL